MSGASPIASARVSIPHPSTRRYFIPLVLAGGRGGWRELFTLVPRINDQAGAGDEAARVYLGLHDREWTGPPDCLLILIQMN